MESIYNGPHLRRRDAWRRCGRGRHPAALNFGHFLTCAVAKQAAQPLLCVGDDFRRTNLLLVELDRPPLSRR